MLNITDWKYEEQQLDAFNDYLKKNIGGRQTKGNHIGYLEEEIDAFFAGWMAAKQQFGVKE